MQSRQRRVGLAIVDHRQQKVRALTFRTSTSNALGFHDVDGVAKAGGVDQGQLNAVDANDFAQDVARGSGNVRHDGPLTSGQSVQQGALAGIRRAHHHHVQSIHQALTACSVAMQIRMQALGVGEARRKLRRGQKIDLFFGKVDRRFDVHSQQGQGLH
jgi:hypothetical protein